MTIFPDNPDEQENLCFYKCDNIGERNLFTCPLEIEALVSAGLGVPGRVGLVMIFCHQISYHEMINDQR